MTDLPRKLTGYACPMCGEKTLEAQGEVVWCSNLGSGSVRPCQFGLGTGEKTIDDVKTTAQHLGLCAAKVA